MKKKIFILFLLVAVMSVPCYGMDRIKDADADYTRSNQALVGLGESNDDISDTTDFTDGGNSDDGGYVELGGSGKACEFPTIGDDYSSDGEEEDGQHDADSTEALRCQLDHLDLATSTPMTVPRDIEELSLPVAVSSLPPVAQRDWSEEQMKVQSSSPEPIDTNTLFLPAGAIDLPENIKQNAEMLRGALIAANEKLRSSKGIVEVIGRTLVVGDLHGDFGTCKIMVNNFAKYFEAGNIENVVFLGDIMDRGNHSALTLLEVLKFFNKYPEKVYLIRGNHETRDMFNRHGARENPARADKHFEHIDKELLFQFFDSLPYAAIINGTTLAVHGGIPSKGGQEIFASRIKRQEASLGFEFGVSEVLWSDYFSSLDFGDARPYIGYHSDRGGNTLCFNEAAAKEFLEFMGLDYMIRAHQPDLGTFHQSPNKIITTVFSAIENQGSFIGKQGAKVAIVDFSGAPKCFAKILPY